MAGRLDIKASGLLAGWGSKGGRGPRHAKSRQLGNIDTKLAIRGDGLVC